MTERDFGRDATADIGGQQPADPSKAVGAPSQTPATSDRVFPAWPPIAAAVPEKTAEPDATASQISVAGEDVPTHTAPQTVPSRRSLRGKPPTSTAGIPVVSAGVPTAPAVLDRGAPVTGATAQILQIQTEAATAPTAPVWSAVLNATDTSAPSGPSAADAPSTVASEPMADGAQTDPADESAQDESAPSPRGHGRLITLIALGVLVVGAGGTGAWYLMTHDESVPKQEVVEASSPTSALQPVDRTATTAFASTLPGTLLQYALTGSQDDAEWPGAGALESYLDTYADAAGDQLTVHTGQWATEEEARSQQTALAGALTGDVLTSGEVTVNGTDAGAVTIVDLGDGTGTAVWSNGTAVFVLTAPIDDVSNAFAAYPV